MNSTTRESAICRFSGRASATIARWSVASEIHEPRQAASLAANTGCGNGGRRIVSRYLPRLVASFLPPRGGCLGDRSFHAHARADALLLCDGRSGLARRLYLALPSRKEGWRGTLPSARGTNRLTCKTLG